MAPRHGGPPGRRRLRQRHFIAKQEIGCSEVSAASSVLAFWQSRVMTSALSRVTDVVTSQQLLAAIATGIELKPISGVQRRRRPDRWRPWQASNKLEIDLIQIEIADGPRDRLVLRLLQRLFEPAREGIVAAFLSGDRLLEE